MTYKTRAEKNIFCLGFMLMEKIKKIDPKEAKLMLSEEIFSSKNEARRLLTQGGISQVFVDPSKTLNLKEQTLKIPPQGLVFKIGKRKFLKIVPSMFR